MDGMERFGSSRSRRMSVGGGGGGGGGLMRSMSRSISSWGGVDDVFAGSASRRTTHAADDEEALRWAAIEKLPTYDRLRTSIITQFVEGDATGKLKREVDVTKLGEAERQQFIDRLFRVAEEDNEVYLKKFRQRIEK